MEELADAGLEDDRSVLLAGAAPGSAYTASGMARLGFSGFTGRRYRVVEAGRAEVLQLPHGGIDLQAAVEQAADARDAHRHDRRQEHDPRHRVANGIRTSSVPWGEWEANRRQT